MIFKLEIQCDNAAFGDEPVHEVATLLERAAQAIRNGTMGAPLYDTNGDRCDRFDFERVNR